MKYLKKLWNWHVTERQRTVILIALLIFAIGFIIWTRGQYDSNFVETF